MYLMSNYERTGFRDFLPSLMHRQLGDKLYMIDVDALCYTYHNNQIVLCGVIDWKNGNKRKIFTQSSSHQALIALSEKLEVPFFIVITYLEEEYPVQMYYVMPSNPRAEALVPEAKWMSVNEYSKFEYRLRGMTHQVNVNNLSNAHEEYDLPELDV